MKQPKKPICKTAKARNKNNGKVKKVGQWGAKPKMGRPQFYDTPDKLMTDCMEYFQWVDDNPLYEHKSFCFQGLIIKDKVQKMRPYTLMGLCNFLGIIINTWNEWRKNRDNLKEVMASIEQIIRNQKFEGAAADLLNPNIIARDLGLSDKKEVTGDGAKPVALIINPVKKGTFLPDPDSTPDGEQNAK